MVKGVGNRSHLFTENEVRRLLEEGTPPKIWIVATAAINMGEVMKGTYHQG